MKYRIKYLPDTVIDREEIKTYLSQFYGSTVKKFFVLLRRKTSQFRLMLSRVTRNLLNAVILAKKKQSVGLLCLYLFGCFLS